MINVKNAKSGVLYFTKTSKDSKVYTNLVTALAINGTIKIIPLKTAFENDRSFVPFIVANLEELTY